jgi:hypothetical protein
MDNGLQVVELMDRVIELKQVMGNNYRPIAGNHDLAVSLVVDPSSFNARERV